MTDDSTDAMAERIASSIRNQTADGDQSRRRFLSRSALAATGLLAVGGGAGVTLAQDGDDQGMPAQAASFDDVAGTDVDVLNYALSLENLENAFYAEALERFDESEFDEADVVSEYSTEADMSVYDYVVAIGEHEAAHVDVLTQAVELLGGDPSTEATYEFGIESVEDVFSLGQVFENTGVAAYAGAAPFVESPDLQSAALSIHSVEARHAAFLNDVNGESFFPNAFDPPSSQDEVLSAVGQFIADSEGEGDGEGSE